MGMSTPMGAPVARPALRGGMSALRGGPSRLEAPWRLLARIVATTFTACALAGATLARADDAPAGAPPGASAPAPGLDCPPPPVPTTEEAVAAGMRDARDAGFLWKATKDGHASWLFGTIHIARSDWRFPGPHVLAALASSDDVALELDPTDPDIVRRLQGLITRRPGSPELPAALETRLRAQIRAACVDPAALAGLRPEMRAISIEVMAGRRLGLEPDYGVDIFLAQLAHELHKPVRSLETPELQASLLVSDDPRQTAQLVGDLVDELESGRGARILARLAADWHESRLDDLSAYRDWCECLETPQERADFVRLIDERNPAMADQVARWHADGRSLFVAVGSLHMVGDIGLPAQLRARGFEVERIDYAQR